MKKVAVLASDNLLPGADNLRSDAFELDEEMGKLVPAFAKHGMELDLIRWRDAAAKAEQYDAFLPLLVWDYFEGNEAAFISEMAKASEHTQIFNRFDVLKWNANKTYLDELENMGAPVIETISP